MPHRAIQRPAARLAAGNADRLGPQPVQLGVQVVRDAQRDGDQLAGGRRGPCSPLQAGAAVWSQQVVLGGRAMMEQGRVHPLQPGGVLIGRRLVAAHQGPDLQHVRRRDPGLRQPPCRQQLPQVASVGLVGLGAPLGPAGGAGIGRFGRVRGDPRPPRLLHDMPPAGAALHREGGLLAGELS
jgi:hypothetical protein